MCYVCQFCFGDDVSGEGQKSSSLFFPFFSGKELMVFPRNKVDGVVVWVHLEDIPMHFKCIIVSHTRYHDNGEG